MRKIYFSLILTLLPMVASADKSGKCGDNVSYTYKSADKTLTISGTGDMYDYDIYNNSEMPPFPSDAQTLVIESGVTSIGWFAFSGMTQLTSVKIPNTISKICKYSFKGCISVKSISSDIMDPSSVPLGTNGYGVFDDIPSTAKLTVPLGTIDKYKSVDGWNRFTNIADPEMSTGKCGDDLIYTYKFADKSLTISGTGKMYDYDIYGPISDMPPFPYGTQSIVIESGVTSIGLFAFSGMTQLTSVKIPNTISEISKYSFKNSSNVNSITSDIKYPSSVPLGFGVFEDNVYANAKLTVPLGTKSRYRSAEGWKNFKNIVEPEIARGKCGANVNYVYDKATHKLTISGEGSMWDLDDSAYYPWDSYRDQIGCVEIESGVTLIGDYAFFCCNNLLSVIIPNSVTSIGMYAFNCCSNLATIVSDITNPFSIEDDVFSNISSSAQLMVPVGTESKYTKINGWRNIPHITESVFVVSELDWREQPNYYQDVSYSDNVTVYLSGAGLVINSNPSSGANYWDSQAPIIAHLPELDEGGQYEVNFKLNAPVSGELRLDLCSMDGSVTKSDIINVTEGIHDYTAKFPDFPSDCKDALVNFQCGKLPGKHIISTVQVVNTKPYLIRKKVVNVATAGTLSYYISEAEKTQINKLTLRGQLNGTDIAFIRRMAGAYVEFLYDKVYASKEEGHELGNLTYLDISEAEIVSGGDYYYRVWQSEEFCPTKASTSDNTISNYMFCGCKLKKLILPETITSIGTHAFKDCSGLTYMDIPDGVTSIGVSAFENCNNISEIIIPNSVTSIGVDAFTGTEWYNSKPNGLVYAGKLAYKYKGEMPANTTIIVNDGTVGIVSKAFDGCSNMTSIIIPNSVTSIGSSAFRGCSSLTSVALPDGLEKMEYGLFENCPLLTCLNIPNNVTYIETGFTKGSSLDKVAIGSGIQKLVQLAIGKKLTALAVLATTPPNFDVDQFTVNYIYVPKGCVAAYKDAWSGPKTDILEIVKGDVNLDGVVDDDDVDALGAYIVGEYPSCFFAVLADLNGDKSIDAGDLVELIDIVKK